MIGSFGIVFALLVYLAPILVVCYLISALSRIGKNVQDLALTLRRLESSQQQPQPPA